MSVQTDLEISASIAEAMLAAIPDAVINTETGETIQIDWKRGFEATSILVSSMIATADIPLEARQNLIDSLTQQRLETLATYEAALA